MGKFIQRSIDSSKNIITEIKEVPVEVIKYVEVPVIQEVKVIETKIVEVIKEVPVEVIKEVKVVEEKIVEVIKEVEKLVEIPVHKIQEVEKKIIEFKNKVPNWVLLTIGIQTLVIVLLALYK